eukprot:3827920-Amphidinium_carterae.2
MAVGLTTWAIPLPTRLYKTALTHLLVSDIFAEDSHPARVLLKSYTLGFQRFGHDVFVLMARSAWR